MAEPAVPQVPCAFGFRDLPPFADMIYLTVGDLDIPAQIPKSFRTV